MLIPDNIDKFESHGERLLYIKFKNDKSATKFYVLHSVFTNYHFKNIHIYHLDTLSIDILKHNKVPKHEVFRFEDDIQNICEICNCRKDQLPVIERNDAIAKRLRIAPGDICKITRISNTAGETEYYRICK